MANKNYALIINDMQNDFVIPGGADIVSGAYATVPTLQKLLMYVRQQKMMVIHAVREYRYDGSDIEITRLKGFLSGKRCAVPGTLGCKIIKELALQEGEYRIVRPRFSAFMQTELDFMLRRLQVGHLIICGTQYPNCVRATVFDAISYGYDVTVVTDATSAETEAIAQANILDMQNIGVACETLQQFIVRHRKLCSIQMRKNTKLRFELELSNGDTHDREQLDFSIRPISMHETTAVTEP